MVDVKHSELSGAELHDPKAHTHDTLYLKRGADDFSSVGTEKTTPANTDLVLIEDSASGNAKKWAQLGNLPGGGGSSTWVGLTDTVAAIVADQLVIGNGAGNELGFTAQTSLLLDNFGTPEDNTDLDASTNYHGLLPKLSGGTDNYLRADGAWAAPSGGSGATAWTGLTDTVATIEADKLVVANGAGTQLGFLAQSTFAASGANSDITSISGLTTDLSITQGGTGQSTAQAAIDALTQVSAATNEHVLTKDTGTGNATWKVGGGGGASTWVGLTDTPASILAYGLPAGNAAGDAFINTEIGINIFELYGGSDVHGVSLQGGSHAQSSYMHIEGTAGSETGETQFHQYQDATHNVEAGYFEGATATPRLCLLHGLNMATKKIENLLAGSAAGDAVRHDQVMLLDGSQAMASDIDLGGNDLLKCFRIYADGTASQLDIYGGTGTGGGSGIACFGKTHTTTAYRGDIRFYNPDAAGNHYLLSMAIDGLTDTPKVGIYHGLDMNSKNIESSGDVTSGTHNTYDLGKTDNRWANIYATNVVTGDLVFEERTCHICGNLLHDAEILSLIVVKTSKKGTHTVPVHISCIGGGN